MASYNKPSQILNQFNPLYYKSGDYLEKSGTLAQSTALLNDFGGEIDAGQIIKFDNNNITSRLMTGLYSLFMVDNAGSSALQIFSDSTNTYYYKPQNYGNHIFKTRNGAGAEYIPLTMNYGSTTISATTRIALNTPLIDTTFTSIKLLASATTINFGSSYTNVSTTTSTTAPTKIINSLSPIKLPDLVTTGWTNVPMYGVGTKTNVLNCTTASVTVVNANQLSYTATKSNGTILLNFSSIAFTIGLTPGVLTYTLPTEITTTSDKEHHFPCIILIGVNRIMSEIYITGGNQLIICSSLSLSTFTAGQTVQIISQYISYNCASTGWAT